MMTINSLSWVFVSLMDKPFKTDTNRKTSPFHLGAAYCAPNIHANFI